MSLAYLLGTTTTRFFHLFSTSEVEHYFLGLVSSWLSHHWNVTRDSRQLKAPSSHDGMISEGATIDDASPVASLHSKWRLLPHFLHMRGLVRQHIDSFNHFVQHEIKAIVNALPNREVSVCYYGGLGFHKLHFPVYSFPSSPNLSYTFPLSRKKKLSLPLSFLFDCSSYINRCRWRLKTISSILTFLRT